MSLPHHSTSSQSEMMKNELLYLIPFIQSGTGKPPDWCFQKEELSALSCNFPAVPSLVFPEMSWRMLAGSLLLKCLCLECWLLMIFEDT